MSDDTRDMLCALQNTGADFLVVGAHALAVHGIVRGTLDFDIWVSPTTENADRVWKALAEFGAPLSEVQREDFVQPDLILQIGVPPHRIDLMTSITGVTFDAAWAHCVKTEILGVTVPVIGRDAMIRNKRATGRPRDRLDADDLESGHDAR